ncbi:tRNA(Met) cytidine acetyltransferase TmcA [Marinomonas spartinae]|uniref:tRNA(Met) cytidine acetyltransferase TmcA n=1 Tax=Marinomonas spartinae TaxID=1792290 RepID=A0A1A8T5Q7_9GAMM|nr:GNAT family N-acetyltransferase [Marinomonas spartinae]SBS27713.1 tRNA(Met) cytidine acetyltransferase TmcA [Marinomonas spartinae]SBS30123.1 tRNA(Met) cytidine acetyltransferase TmcA [Marinomonas spartinae]
MSNPANLNHRHCYLFTGNTAQIYAAFSLVSNGQDSILICTHDEAIYRDLNKRLNTDIRLFKQIKNTLGQTYDAILIDVTSGVSASVIAILAGAVRGDGIFAIGLPDQPEQNWLNQEDQEMPRYLPWPYHPDQIKSHFKRYILNQLIHPHSPFQYIRPQQIDRLTPPQNHTVQQPQHAMTLTQEQKVAQKSLLTSSNVTHVLIASRGRGKSTLLGDTLAKWVKAGKKVAVTAATPDALVALRKQYDDQFSSFNVSSDNKDEASEMPFYAPDTLLLMEDQWEHLIIDEAARLSIPVLTALLDKSKQCIFSTTDYGYEGAGRGFGIRFCQTLDAPRQGKSTPLKRLSLTQPIRWGENDPLEKWVNNTFFLCPPFEAHSNTSEQSATQLISTQQGQEWLQEPEHLKVTFSLLVNAHYQTSPDNIRWMLDDPSVTTWLSQSDSPNKAAKPAQTGITSITTNPQVINNMTINSVAIVTEEGELPDDLSQAVLEGSRRPRGHLVPQSLMAHEGFIEAGHYHYWRISRIATQPNLQGQGLASHLLEQITEAAQTKADFLCTSFAASPDIVAFWQKNGFISVRLGTSKDKASGSYSLMMVKPLNSIAEQQSKQWYTLFLKRFQTNLLLCYQDLSAALIIQLIQCPHQTISPANLLISEQDKQDLHLFCYAHRPFDTIRAALYNAFFQLAYQDKLTARSSLDTLLFDAVLGRETPFQLKAAKLTGRKDLHLALKQTLKREIFASPKSQS